jgi:hypothetical protein
MKFLNKWYVAATAIIIAYFLATANSHMLCWDGVEVNGPLLKEVCGVTEQEYWNMTAANESFCPDAWTSEAIHMIGGCDIVWEAVAMYAISALAAFNAAYAIAYVVFLKQGAKKRRTSRSRSVF